MGREEENAETSYREYLKQAPQDGVAHFLFAKFHEKQQKFVDCAKSANLAAVNGQGELRYRANLLFRRCRVLGAIGLKEAIKELKDMYEASPSAIPTLLEYVDALANTGLLSDAIELTRAGVEKIPRSYELRMKLGDLYERNKELDRAVRFYSRAAKDRQSTVEPWMKIGKVFESQGNFLEAARSFETGARKQDSYPEGFLFAARAYRRAGMAYKEKALKLYEEELEARPSNIGTFTEAAEFMLETNVPEEVPKLFQKFGSNLNDDPRALLRLAQAHAATGDTQSAKQNAELVIGKNPDLPEAYRILGQIYEKEGNYVEAKGAYERYLKLLPSAPDEGMIRAKISKPPF